MEARADRLVQGEVVVDLAAARTRARHLDGLAGDCGAASSSLSSLTAPPLPGVSEGADRLTEAARALVTAAGTELAELADRARARARRAVETDEDNAERFRRLDRRASR